MTHTADQLITRDAEFCWHPFTQAQTAKAPLPIVRGEAEFLFDAKGKRYFDAVSSWWVNLHGHCNPIISEAIKAQLDTLEHVMFAGITHPAAIDLAQALVERAPQPLKKVFFSDNGSTAIEVALKVAFQHWSNLGLGQQRRKLLALQGGYHGDTFGAMAAGRSSGFYDPFKPWLFEVEFLPTGTCACTEEEALSSLDSMLAQQGDQIAALILEPLVQGASGMRMMRAEHVAEITKRCQRAGVLVIFDEVMTGFGRTGSLFAAQQVAQFGGHADLLCLSKGLTGGYMPMGATLASQALYDSFLSDDVGKAFLHGHSYTANPLGCAAGLASLQLLDNTATQRNIERIHSIHQYWQVQLSAHPLIENPRVCGTIAAFELKSPTDAYGSASSQWLREAFLDHSIIVRPLGNTMYWIPPYCTSSDTLEHAYQILLKVLKQWEVTQARLSSDTELF
ncbi:MAG TPA: adenosylmethionine--8-amino-7-oxononanoate transaminase [Limnobacter sp.]|uniref:adenosylmethionine--8-amino-7-oxononanoate transaminase n=1 Tax=Limnobacter sp. TaxID=2003368 RepID=UPI002E362AA4|nr:adenosylmethionine--8-amino-7-oxononanoate transaminase [Limnobacter sp.]HEX5487241.1 adenosylmethionine--8-amino-7-oxononanoate transaminase [Limnobacter sp.]